MGRVRHQCRYRRLSYHADGPAIDQANLISLLLRRYHGQWGYVVDAAFGRELRPYAETFVHFTTHKSALMEAYYSQVLGLTLAD